MSALFISNIVAMESSTNPSSEFLSENSMIYKTFAEYKTEMQKKGLPLILVIGCGHITSANQKFYQVMDYHGGGNHEHPNSWSVDISIKDDGTLASRRYKEQINKFDFNAEGKAYWQWMGANGEMDITNSRFSQYMNTFDIVFIERPYAQTLDNPWTLWNATSMLKIGGELIIDAPEQYSYNNYIKSSNFYNILYDPTLEKQSQHNIFDHLYDDSNKTYHPLNYFIEIGKKDMLYGADFDSENIVKKLKTLNVNINQIARDDNLATMGSFLAMAHFKNIVTVKNATLPYNNRLTSVLSATKTQETQKLLRSWKRKIENYLKEFENKK